MSPSSFPIPRIETIAQKNLVGDHLTMCLSANKTFQLWQRFMPRRNNIAHAASSDLFSLQIYSPPFSIHTFTMETLFEKWAAREVSQIEGIPEGMDTMLLPSGLYAVFPYKGTPAHFEPFFRYMFQTWMPSSGYEVDDRPHFEILGEKYKLNDPDSEEEIWVPIRLKNK